MSQALEKYLDRVMIYADRSEADAPKIRAELKDHLLKKIEELEANGAKREDAIFQAIEIHGSPKNIGYGLRARFPWLDVRTKGTARGFIAVGPKAVGIIAFGGIACGVISYGGIAVGLLSLGGIAFSLLFALGGLAFAPAGLAYGGIAVGLISVGGLSAGVTSAGGLAFGLLSLRQYSGHAISYFTQQNAPDFVKSVSEIMNRNFLGTVVIVFWISCIVMLVIQLLLSRRELRRIIQADPSLAEEN